MSETLRVQRQRRVDPNGEMCMWKRMGQLFEIAELTLFVSTSLVSTKQQRYMGKN